MDVKDEELLLAPRAKGIARRMPRTLSRMLMLEPARTLQAVQDLLPNMLGDELNLCRWTLHQVGIPLPRQEEVMAQLQARFAVLLVRYIDLVSKDQPLDEREAEIRRELSAAKSPADLLRVLANAVEDGKGN